MIISVEDLKKQIDTGDTPDDLIAAKLKAIEAIIRAYTNNNFQQRGIRFIGQSKDGRVYGNTLHFNVGDTVQISSSQGINDGLYQITILDDTYIELDEELSDIEENMVTKISYPADVVQCAVNLYEWNQNMGEKVGIKSETISRHSVTYEDSATLFMGYPTGILNGLILHKKARC